MYSVIYLKNLAVFYPILFSMGFKLTGPIIIYSQSRNFAKIMDLLRVFDKDEMSYNSDFVFFTLFGQQRDTNKFYKIKSDILAYDNGRLGIPVFLVCEEFFYECFSDEICFYLDGDDLESIVDPIEYCDKLENLEILRDEGLRLSGKFKEPSDVLAGMLYPFVREYCARFYPAFVEGLMENIRNFFSNAFEHGLGMNLVDVFFEYFTSWVADPVSGLILVDLDQDIKPVSFNSEEDLTRVILFKNNYLFLDESLLKSFITSYFPSISINAFKRSLSNAGIILGDKGSYTSKICLPFRGLIKRVRMARLNLEKFDAYSNENLQPTLRTFIKGVTYEY